MYNSAFLCVINFISICKYSMKNGGTLNERSKCHFVLLVGVNVFRIVSHCLYIFKIFKHNTCVDNVFSFITNFPN